jgi:hypothetical protein
MFYFTQVHMRYAELSFGYKRDALAERGCESGLDNPLGAETCHPRQLQ